MAKCSLFAACLPYIRLAFGACAPRAHVHPHRHSHAAPIASAAAAAAAAPLAARARCNRKVKKLKESGNFTSATSGSSRETRPPSELVATTPRRRSRDLDPQAHTSHTARAARGSNLSSSEALNRFRRRRRSLTLQLSFSAANLPPGCRGGPKGNDVTRAPASSPLETINQFVC